jgi:hypothetical protein
LSGLLKKYHRESSPADHIRYFQGIEIIDLFSLTVPLQHNARRNGIGVKTSSLHNGILPLNPVKGQKVMQEMSEE